VCLYLTIAHLIPAPDGVSPQGWRITAIFLVTMAGMILEPLPGAAVVLAGIVLLVLVGSVPLPKALSGYSTPTVWLVLAAMMISRVLRETGLSRRIALLFVRGFGSTSLGTAYALQFADVTLATGIPSITARSGGIMLPIARSISVLYDSHPGASSKVLGRFLITALYQGSVIASAMFMSGQASNVLAVTLAARVAGVTVTWPSWFLAAIVPGLLSCLVIPWLVYRMLPPDVKRTPGAAQYAADEIKKMGPVGLVEAMVLAIFVGICLLWLTSAWHGLDVTVVALIGVIALFLTNALTWDGVLAERGAWDVYIWYGGLLTLGDALSESGSTQAFAKILGAWFDGWPWMAVFLVTVGVYFYAHYLFASITTHVLSMFAQFTVMLIALGAPPLLVVYSLACLTNLTAGLTHYGTTTGPIVFNEGFVSMKDWWRVGLAASIVNLTIWLTVGLLWWKFLGFW
jgi:DASS family divalent anion:Na+ symporter